MYIDDKSKYSFWIHQYCIYRYVYRNVYWVSTFLDFLYPDHEFMLIHHSHKFAVIPVYFYLNIHEDTTMSD